MDLTEHHLNSLISCTRLSNDFEIYLQNLVHFSTSSDCSNFRSRTFHLHYKAASKSLHCQRHRMSFRSLGNPIQHLPQISIFVIVQMMISFLALCRSSYSRTAFTCLCSIFLIISTTDKLLFCHRINWKWQRLTIHPFFYALILPGPWSQPSSSFSSRLISCSKSKNTSLSS